MGAEGKLVPLSQRNPWLRRVTDAARRLPGADVAEQRLREAESLLLGELKLRLAQLDAGDLDTGTVAERYAARMAAPRSRDAAIEQLNLRILDQLLDDELRIVGALSEGDAAAMIHVGIGPPVGPLTQRLRANLTQLGKRARLVLPERASLYVAHLRHLALVETGPEDKALDVDYQLLEGDKEVRDLTASAPRSAGQRVRIIRRSLHLSELGQGFWAACQAGAR